MWLWSLFWLSVCVCASENHLVMPFFPSQSRMWSTSCTNEARIRGVWHQCYPLRWDFPHMLEICHSLQRLEEHAQKVLQEYELQSWTCREPRTHIWNEMQDLQNEFSHFRVLWAQGPEEQGQKAPKDSWANGTNDVQIYDTTILADFSWSEYDVKPTACIIYLLLRAARTSFLRMHGIRDRIQDMQSWRSNWEKK